MEKTDKSKVDFYWHHWNKAPQEKISSKFDLENLN
jgi:hypothetical protein